MTTASFQGRWEALCKDKNSVLCAGFDPKPSDLNGQDKLDWAMDYLNQVADYVPAIKPNACFWGNIGDIARLRILRSEASKRNCLFIYDRKCADIGSTNAQEMDNTAAMHADAITIAPYAGNMAQLAEQARKRNMATISMVLMSNPEYAQEKNQWVQVSSEGPRTHFAEDVWRVGDQHFVPRYIRLVQQAHEHGLDGIVVGAPSKKNHVTEDEMKRVSRYFKGVVLMPGIGTQGGDAEMVWNYFRPDQVIVNVGGGLIRPKEGTKRDAARHYQEAFNALRGTA